jgi:hypothetical protein
MFKTTVKNKCCVDNKTNVYKHIHQGKEKKIQGNVSTVHKKDYDTHAHTSS